MTRKILIADDDINLLNLTALRLIEGGYEVLTAMDGFQAVRMAHQQKPDLIIMDYRMPAGGGLGACENLKSDPEMKHIPIIFLTAYDTEDLKDKVLMKGARDFIAKPFKADVLLKKIREILGE